MSILLLILAAIPAIIAIINWWKARKPASPETLQTATDLLQQINAAVENRKRLGPIPRLAIAQLRRRCEQATAIKVADGTPQADAFLTQCGTLSAHCRRMGIDAAAYDSDLADLKSSKT